MRLCCSPHRRILGGSQRGEQPTMRVLAASFPDSASARAARDQLVRAFTLEAEAIGVEALANGSKRKDAAILAGRFKDEVVAAAIEVVTHFGGTLVIDIDDRGSNA
jgi:hypothetical protein